MMDELLTLDAFEMWLQAFPDDTSVGVAGSEGYCPLALYLTEKTGVSFLVGHGRYYEAAFPVLSGRELPEWATAFVLVVDGLLGTYQSVSRSFALDMLALLRQGKRAVFHSGGWIAW